MPADVKIQKWEDKVYKYAFFTSVNIDFYLLNFMGKIIIFPCYMKMTILDD